MNVFDELKVHAAGLQLHPGMTLKTSLLGIPQYEMRDGKAVGIVPPELQWTAREHGFVVEAALPHDGYYVLRLMTPNDASNRTPREAPEAKDGGCRRSG